MLRETPTEMPTHWRRWPTRLIHNRKLTERISSSFFAGIAASAGQANSTATTNQTVQQQVVSTAQSQRDQISKVSLDGQAAEVLQFQRAYQAVSQVLTIVNDLADSILDVIPLSRHKRNNQ